jgi:hypothetical protein
MRISYFMVRVRVQVPLMLRLLCVYFSLFLYFDFFVHVMQCIHVRWLHAMYVCMSVCMYVCMFAL